MEQIICDKCGEYFHRLNRSNESSREEYNQRYSHLNNESMPQKILHYLIDSFDLCDGCVTILTLEIESLFENMCTISLDLAAHDQDVLEKVKEKFAERGKTNA